MNDTFSTARFLGLLKRFFFENRTMIVAALAISARLISFYPSFQKFHMYGGDWIPRCQFEPFLVILTLGSLFFAVLLTDFSPNPAKSTTYWTLPASNFEKWLVFVVVIGGFMACLYGFLSRA
ncbi:MAG: hypothetical protein U5L45_21075 [Saprospiraceae bacterium]|nr:hypothetical protein [Saprospiraceae bacterium]